MRRRRPWPAVGATLVLLSVAVVLALPAVVRWAAVRQLEEMLGRDVTIADVDVNLFTRTLAATDVRVEGTGGRPLAAIQGLRAEFRYLPLFRGRVRLTRLEVREPVVRIVREAGGRLDIQDVIDRLASRPAGRALPLLVESGVLSGGRVVLDDRAVEPDGTWTAEGIEVELRDVGAGGEPRGTASARLTLAGAPVTVDATDVGLAPTRARATVAVAGLDLAPLAIYVPGDAPIRPTAGTFSIRVQLEYEAGAGLRAGGSSRIESLAFHRPMQDPPFVTVPVLDVTSRDVTWDGERLGIGHVEVSGAPTVLDAGVDPPQRHAVASLRLVGDDLGYPAATPGRVALTGAVADGGTVDARGTLALYPVATRLDVRIEGADLGKVRPYLPPDSPVGLAGGAGAAVLDVAYATASGLRVSGDVTLRRLVVTRDGQREPLVTHPELRASIGDLTLRGGRLAVAQATFTGSPTIVDGSVSPPQRFEVQAHTVTVRDLTWPSRGPAEVSGRLRLASGASAAVDGTFDARTLETRARARIEGVAIERFAAYLPPDAALELAGRVTSDATVSYARGRPLTADLHATVTDARVAAAGGDRAPLLAVPSLRLDVDDLAVGRGLSVGRVAAAGAPTVAVPGTRAPLRLAIPEVSLTAEGVAWPARAPARVSLFARLPDAGSASVAGEVDLDDRAFDVAVEISDAAIGPYAPLLEIRGPVAGRLDAKATVGGTIAGDLDVHARGTATARSLRVGPAEQPAIAVERVVLRGIEARWPERVTIGVAHLERPSALIEREEDGSFPIAAMLRRAEEEPAAAAPRTSATTPEGGGLPAPGSRLHVTVGELRLADGDARFIDRTTRPTYSEEVTSLALRVEGLATTADSRAKVDLQAIVGVNAALELHGVMALFAEPFFLDVTGELRQFPVPRTNPYLRRFLDWIARRGELSTRVHYRVEGRQLEGTNEIVVRRLAVEPAGSDPDRVVGLPLGLVVSLLKNPQGDIKLTVPVSGDLGQPRFSFGDAIATAVKNVLTNLVTGPFRAIGKIFGKGDEVEAVAVDPVVFDAGSAVVSPEGGKQVQRVADFLRASPYVRLGLAPVVTDEDLAALRAQAVAARIQRLQRQAGLPDFETAARTLFQSRFPDREPPRSVDAVVAALRQSEPVADDAARRLAERRVLSARQALADEAGVDPGRLVEAPSPPPGAAGAPRVEFRLLPEE